MKVERRGIKRQRLDQRNHPRVEGDEVHDRPGDVAERELGLSAFGRYGNPFDLLRLDRGRDRGIAQQRVRDAEAITVVRKSAVAR
jgi:hypothetical protein